MLSQGLPQASDDVLRVPEGNVPEVIHQLIGERALSSLLQEVHRELASPDPGARAQAARALRHLGFAE